MSNEVSINSMKQVAPAPVSKAAEPLDESYEAYFGGLSEGFDSGYAAGFRAATIAIGKATGKALKAAVIPTGETDAPRQQEQYDAYKLTACLHQLNNQRYWLRYSGKRKFAGATAAKREYLSNMKDWMGF